MDVSPSGINVGTRFKLGETLLDISPESWKDLTFEAIEAPNERGWFGAYSLDGQEFHLHLEHVGDIL